MAVGNYDVKQITNLINDAVSDVTGKSASIKTLDTTSVVSLGKSLADMQGLEGFFGALANRIMKTIYFVRAYEPTGRHVMRDESAFGAYVQKVYYGMPDAVDNATWGIPEPVGQTYTQASPYDVETTIAVSAKIFGTQGTWSIEVVRPIDQIKTAFLNESEMAQFIDGIYMQIENAFKLQLEALESTAINTSIANTLLNGKSASKRNLLSEYNTLFTKTLTAEKALYDADFLKYASREIKLTIDQLERMTGNFNAEGYLTFTSKENLAVELLSQFASASATYLEADTFHNELVALPGYNTVPYWQTPGATFAFADCSAIKVQHDDFIDEDTEGDEGVVSQSGIIAVLRDDEACACHFGDRKSWEMINPRQDIVIHGEKARKGYAVDGHANEVVFFIADEEEEAVEA